MSQSPPRGVADARKAFFFPPRNGHFKKPQKNTGKLCKTLKPTKTKNKNKKTTSIGDCIVLEGQAARVSPTRVCNFSY